MIQRILKLPDLWIGLGLLLTAAWGIILIAGHGLSTPVLPADAYFYLSKAENFAAGRGLTTYWNDGIDRKFFPLHSIVLAPFSLLRPLMPAYWIVTEILYYLLTGLVLLLLVRRVEPSRSVGFIALLCWLTNPNVILWHAVPYSEGLATLLMWTAVLLCSRGWRACSARRFALAAAFGGLALATRAEAVILAVALGCSVLWTIRREGLAAIPWRRLGLGAALFVLPLLLWWASLPAGDGAARLSYVEEFRERFTWDQIAYNFRVLFSSVLFEINLHPDAPWKVVLTVVGSRLYLVAVGLALAGVFGARGRWICLAVLGYQGLHAFWHYAYGRFNLILLPLMLYLFALALRWVFASWARFVLTALLILGGDLLDFSGDRAALLRPLVMIAGGLVIGLAVGRYERRLANGSRVSPSAPDSGLLVRPAGFRPLPLLYAFGAALGLVMFQLGSGAAIRHKQFLLRDDARTHVRGSQIEAVVLRLQEGEACLMPVDFPLAYAVATLTGQRVWFSNGLGDFFPEAFDRRRTAEFLDEKNIGLILSPQPLESWLRDYHIPENAAKHLTMRKRVPAAYLMEWES